MNEIPTAEVLTRVFRFDALKKQRAQADALKPTREQIKAEERARGLQGDLTKAVTKYHQIVATNRKALLGKPEWKPRLADLEKRVYALGLVADLLRQIPAGDHVSYAELHTLKRVVRARRAYLQRVVAYADVRQVAALRKRIKALAPIYDLPDENQARRLQRKVGTELRTTTRRQFAFEEIDPAYHASTGSQLFAQFRKAGDSLDPATVIGELWKRENRTRPPRKYGEQPFKNPDKLALSFDKGTVCAHYLVRGSREKPSYAPLTDPDGKAPTAERPLDTAKAKAQRKSADDLEGAHLYVMRQNELFHYPPTASAIHSRILAGQDVQCAGFIAVERGKVTVIGNGSGHYMPTWFHLLATVKYIAAHSAFAENAVVALHVGHERYRMFFSPADYIALGEARFPFAMTLEKIAAYREARQAELTKTSATCARLGICAGVVPVGTEPHFVRLLKLGRFASETDEEQEELDDEGLQQALGQLKKKKKRAQPRYDWDGAIEAFCERMYSGKRQNINQMLVPVLRKFRDDHQAKANRFKTESKWLTKRSKTLKAVDAALEEYDAACGKLLADCGKDLSGMSRFGARFMTTLKAHVDRAKRALDEVDKKIAEWQKRRGTTAKKRKQAVATLERRLLAEKAMLHTLAFQTTDMTSAREVYLDSDVFGTDKLKPSSGPALIAQLSQGTRYLFREEEDGKRLHWDREAVLVLWEERLARLKGRRPGHASLKLKRLGDDGKVRPEAHVSWWPQAELGKTKRGLGQGTAKAKDDEEREFAQDKDLRLLLGLRYMTEVLKDDANERAHCRAVLHRVWEGASDEDRQRWRKLGLTDDFANLSASPSPIALRHKTKLRKAATKRDLLDKTPRDVAENVDWIVESFGRRADVKIYLPCVCVPSSKPGRLAPCWGLSQQRMLRSWEYFLGGGDDFLQPAYVMASTKLNCAAVVWERLVDGYAELFATLKRGGKLGGAGLRDKVIGAVTLPSDLISAGEKLGAAIAKLNARQAQLEAGAVNKAAAVLGLATEAKLKGTSWRQLLQPKTWRRVLQLASKGAKAGKESKSFAIAELEALADASAKLPEAKQAGHLRKLIDYEKRCDELLDKTEFERPMSLDDPETYERVSKRRDELDWTLTFGNMNALRDELDSHRRARGARLIDLQRVVHRRVGRSKANNPLLPALLLLGQCAGWAFVETMVRDTRLSFDDLTEHGYQVSRKPLLS